MMSEIDENSRRERHEYDKHVLCYKCISPKGSHKTKVPFVFDIHDISYGGLGIVTNQMLYPGSLMSFRIDTSDGNREFTVIVRWSRYNGERYESGLQFVDVMREDIVFLHKIVQHLK